MNWFDQSRYFRDDQADFDSPDEPGSREKMNIAFLDMLEEARALSPIPFKINSGYRSAKHNKRVGGVDSSAHTEGRAVDIRVSNDYERYKIITCLLKVGFNRIGIAQTFVHVDSDPTKNPGRIWKY